MNINKIRVMFFTTILLGYNNSASFQSLNSITPVTNLKKTESNILFDITQEKVKQKGSLSLPIHGELDKHQIELYYPNILDTVKDPRIIGAEYLTYNREQEIYTSMLYNSGTFDQLFVCTHNRNFSLLNSYYIGKATQFDGTSHTINYKIINDSSIVFHHVDWGYVKKKNALEIEIDTTHYYSYKLTISKSGKIIKI
jgi:hypothetical protein